MTSWSDGYPSGYLREYYSDVAPDEQQVLGALVDLLARERVGGRVLDFGCGPILDRAIAAAARAERVTLADLLPENLDAVRAWLEERPGCHDWSAFTEFILKREGNPAPTAAEVRARERSTRRIVDVRTGDATLADPLGSAYRGSFDAVLAGFCLEAIATTPAQFAEVAGNVLSLVAPGGLAVVMTLVECSGYRMDGAFFDCYPVREEDLVACFRAAGFGDATIVRQATPEQRERGYTAMFFAHARKPRG